MRAIKQLKFPLFVKDKWKKSAFGSSLLKNSNPKKARPISTKSPMHIVLRSEIAHGELSMMRHNREIEKIITDQGKTLGVKVYQFANVGNHLHLLVLRASSAVLKAIFKICVGSDCATYAQQRARIGL